MILRCTVEDRPFSRFPSDLAHAHTSARAPPLISLPLSLSLCHSLSHTHTHIHTHTHTLYISHTLTRSLSLPFSLSLSLSLFILSHSHSTSLSHTLFPTHVHFSRTWLQYFRVAPIRQREEWVFLQNVRFEKVTKILTASKNLVFCFKWFIFLLEPKFLLKLNFLWVSFCVSST